MLKMFSSFIPPPPPPPPPDMGPIKLELHYLCKKCMEYVSGKLVSLANIFKLIAFGALNFAFLIVQLSYYTIFCRMLPLRYLSQSQSSINLPYTA